MHLHEFTAAISHSSVSLTSLNVSLVSRLSLLRCCSSPCPHLHLYFFFVFGHSAAHGGPLPRIRSELQLRSKPKLQQCQVLNPLCQARNRTCTPALQRWCWPPLCHSRNSSTFKYIPFSTWGVGTKVVGTMILNLFNRFNRFSNSVTWKIKNSADWSLGEWLFLKIDHWIINFWETRKGKRFFWPADREAIEAIIPFWLYRVTSTSNWLPHTHSSAAPPTRSIPHTAVSVISDPKPKWKACW